MHTTIQAMESQNKPYALPLLTPYLRDEIIFAMEDQERDYHFDLESGLPVPTEEIDPLEVEEHPDRFLPLPDWKPADGFRMMERFANRVRNPYYRQKLLAALEAGRGVFRRFKDTLAEQPALERQWFAYKDMEMERRVLAWYRSNHGAIELQELEPEPEELTDDILQEDFVISTEPDEQALDEIETLASSLLDELRQGTVERMQACRMLRADLKRTPPTDYVYARSQGGALAGFVAYRIPQPDTAEIVLFGNAPEFRGLGLFGHLFDVFSRTVSRKGVRSLVVPLAGDALGFDEYFAKREGKPVSKRMLLSTDGWNSSRPSSDIAYL